MAAVHRGGANRGQRSRNRLAMAGRIAEVRRVCDGILQADPALCIYGIKSSPFRRLEDVEKLGQASRMACVLDDRL